VQESSGRQGAGKVAGSLSGSAERIISRVEGAVAGMVTRLACNARGRLLVALSGGPDSVALLHALERIHRHFHFQLAAAHLNHGLRGAESDRDEDFVRQLCEQLRIELVVERATGLKPPNLEERARELRYQFLNRAADTLKAQFIMLGHHRDDQAETVLLRLLRGSGIAGLAGMAKVGPGRLVRPLLSIDRAAILAYLEAIGADHVVDSSNTESGAVRNRVRARLLPLLAGEYSPGIARRLASLALEMREVSSFIEGEACRSLGARLLDQVATSEVRSWRMEVRGFESINPALARAILREFVRRAVGHLRQIERVHIEAMYRLAISGNPSAVLTLPREWRFRREYDTVTLDRGPAAMNNHAAPKADCGERTLLLGENLLGVGGFILTVREVAAQELGFPAAPWHPTNRFEAYLDATEAPVLTVRYVRAGDHIRPLGLQGKRKVHDVFVDHKVALGFRRSWPLVVSDNEVVWIPGLVRSGFALVTSASKKVLHLRADRIEPSQKFELPEV